VLLAVSLACVAASCGSSGTDLREPPAGVTSPAPTTTTTATVPPADVFRLTSPAFDPAAEMPAAYTCGTLSPPIGWEGVPAGTTELVLTVTSPRDDGLDVHWIVAGLAPDSTGIDEGTIPLDAIEGPNSAGGFGWDGPCPEPGETVTLEVTLAALGAASALDPAMSAEEVIDHLVTLPATRTVTTATVTGAAATSTTTG
jgi:phosphatidylethanolamine-binding protein (PEBP) family uncharacterized protein